MTKPASDDLQAADELTGVVRQIKSELSKTIVGQHRVIDDILTVMLARGHCLLVGVPGLAKTLLVRSLAACLDLQFRRIQFTPDLMPSDITGTELIQHDPHTGERELRFHHGPIFSNIILADEINRTPPKTQAALLEAMQEMQVTASGMPRKLPVPFFVMATQNPIEQQGTYPLPEAQLDRFMFSVVLDFPTEAEELEIAQQKAHDVADEIASVISAKQIQSLCDFVPYLPIAPHIAKFAVRLCRLTRPEEAKSPDFVRQYVSWGAGPRASQNLVLAAKSRAFLKGQPYVDLDDVKEVALSILRHRVRVNFSAQSDGVSSSQIIEQLIEFVPQIENDQAGTSIAKIFRPASHR